MASRSTGSQSGSNNVQDAADQAHIQHDVATSAAAGYLQSLADAGLSHAPEPQDFAADHGMSQAAAVAPGGYDAGVSHDTSSASAGVDHGLSESPGSPDGPDLGPHDAAAHDPSQYHHP